MPFKKGQSGNPKGRPPAGLSFNDQLRVVLTDDGNQPLGTVKKGKTALRTVVEQLVKAALEGDAWAVREVADRLDGKPTQTIDQNINDKRSSTDWSRDELVDLLHDARAGSNGTAKTNGRNGTIDSVH